MATSKVAFFSPSGDRANYMVEQAPANIEIVLVDPALSDDEKVSLCQDVDAIISSDVSLGVLRRSPDVRLEFILLKHAMQGMSGRREAGATALAGPYITIGLPTFGMDGVVD